MEDVKCMVAEQSKAEQDEDSHATKSGQLGRAVFEFIAVFLFVTLAWVIPISESK